MAEKRDSDRNLETVKMYQDTFKHITTFSSGALVVAVTVTGAFFPEPDMLGVLVFSFLLFLIGAAAGILGLVRAPTYLEETRNTAGLRMYLRASVYVTYLGLAMFAAFALANFYNYDGKF